MVSGIYGDKNDMMHVADSESESVARNHDGWNVAVDAQETIYGAEVGPRAVKKYVK